jgi:hypothetical protein
MILGYFGRETEKAEKVARPALAVSRAHLGIATTQRRGQAIACPTRTEIPARASQ